jgi:cell division protein FtsW (lipid II flippase)
MEASMKAHLGPFIVLAVILGLVALAAGVSLTTVLLIAVILACPLMMLFMHGGGGHGGHDGSWLQDERRTPSSGDQPGPHDEPHRR